jgi:hypothetical protein
MLSTDMPAAAAEHYYCCCCCCCVQLPQALELLDEMQSFGEQFAPSAYTYNEIIRACR